MTVEDAGGDEVPALRKRVAELERLLAERDVELELERGKVVMGTTALAEANRRCADAEHQLRASGVADAQDAAAADLAKTQAEAKAKANPHWTPNGASPPRSARKGARAGSPLSELKAQRMSLKPSRRAAVQPDDTVPASLREKNKILTEALMRTEADFKRERDHSTKQISQLQKVVEKLAMEAGDLHEAAALDVSIAREVGTARDQAAQFNKLYQNEVRKRQILEKKSTREVQKRDAELAEKTERIRKLEQEMISLQRTAPSRTRAFLGLDE